MADQPTEKPDAPAPAGEGQDAAPAAETKTEQSTEEQPSAPSEPAPEGKEAPTEESKPEQAELKDNGESKTAESKDEPAEAADESKEKEDEKPAAEGDSEMPDTPEAASAPEADQSTAEAASKTPAAKTQNRRKSTGGSTRKSLSKKASKAKMTHLDAKPGDQFLVKLKGFPEWPAIICDESMLPHALLTTRPVTAARPDGTYAENYADGGKRAYDRNFPVMYLFTNEFGWVVNTALTELTPEMAQNALGASKIRKDLKAAFELAAEQHPLDYYKDVLKKFEEEFLAKQQAAQAAAATPKKSKKAKAAEADEDVEMADVGASAKSKNKKRKAEDETSTPQRSESAKKPKIKLNTSTSKKPNGSTAQAKDSSGKAKVKKSGEKKEAPKENLTPEERLERREKEVKFLRYKLQRGLLNKEHAPKEEEMKEMSDFVKMLEKLPDLEGSIIRQTSIHKVLKQILRLKSIPRENEFNFKKRSQTLLDKYLKAMAADPASAFKPPTNGVDKAPEAEAEKPAEGSEQKEEAPAADKPAEAAEASGEAKEEAEKAEPSEQKVEVEAS